MKTYIVKCTPKPQIESISIHKPEDCNNKVWGSDCATFDIRTRKANKIKPFTIETNIHGIKALRRFAQKSWTI